MHNCSRLIFFKGYIPDHFREKEILLTFTKCSFIKGEQNSHLFVAGGNGSEAAFQRPPQDHSSFAVQAQGNEATEPGTLE